MKNLLKIKVKGFIDMASPKGLQINMNEIIGFAKKESIEDRTIKQVNKNFIIRYKHFDHPQTFLIGAGQYYKLVGTETANKHFKTVLDMKEDKRTFKIRKSLIIDFLQK